MCIRKFKNYYLEILFIILLCFVLFTFGYGEDIIGQTKELLSRYRQGDGKAYSELLVVRDEKAFPVFFAVLNDTDERVRKLAIRKVVTFKKKEEDWYIMNEAAEALKNITGQNWRNGIQKLPPKFRVRDEELTLERCEEAIKWFRESFPELIEKAKTVKDN